MLPSMRIDFDDLEVPLAELASAGAEWPRREVRDRFMARIDADEPPVPMGFAFNLATQFDRWIPHAVPGIRVRPLSVNRDRGYATLLLDVAPGTRFPAHHHSGAEDCYVISGSLFTWGRRLRAGDFLHADAGSDHTEMWTDEGCQVLLVVPSEGYLSEPAG
jgi:quercetin dioxygenase-like cupin family protein